MNIRPDILEKYGDVVCTFSSYYKYMFTYEGKAEDGATVQLSVGGDSGDIYKHEVNAGDTLTLNNDLDSLSIVTVERDGAEVYSETDF